ITVGSFHGGTTYNVIPDEVRLKLTVRSFEDAVRQQLLSGIERMAKGLALAAGIPAERAPVVTVDQNEFTPAAYNDPKLVQRLVGVLREGLGAENVVPRGPVMGGEDFGLFGDGRKIPAALLWLGASDPADVEKAKAGGKPLPSLHSSLFAPLPEPTVRT